MASRRVASIPQRGRRGLPERGARRGSHTKTRKPTIITQGTAHRHRLWSKALVRTPTATRV
ncbi:transposase [Micromonospora sp. ATCC 39149]|nr:transposase [Micromonospora sp. ATCC 39149]